MVRIRCTTSKSLPVTKGVPQRSNHCPLLLTLSQIIPMFMNDFSTCLQDSMGNNSAVDTITYKFISGQLMLNLLTLKI